MDRPQPLFIGSSGPPDPAALPGRFLPPEPPAPQQDPGFSFAGFANAVARAAGKPRAFVLACALIIVWAATGPAFGFSDTWQLVINTGTTIITFLMVFLIQATQNRDGAAIQLKLDELIKASQAPNRAIGIERRSEEEIEAARLHCETEAKEP